MRAPLWAVGLLVFSVSVCTVSASDTLESAQNLMKTGDYESAIVLLSSLKAPEALRLLGDCHKATKNWQRAIKCYQEILGNTGSPFPQDEVKTWIMDCQLAGNNPGNALNLLEKLVAEYPDHAGRFYYVIGRRYQWTHQYGDAVKALQQAVDKLQPNDPVAKDAAQRYICCCLSAMDFNSALNYLPTYARHYPDRISAVFSTQMYRWKFKVPEAIKAVEKALEGTPANVVSAHELRISLADCYVATENWEKASSRLAQVPKSYQETSSN